MTVTTVDRPRTATQYADLGQELTKLAFEMTWTGFPVDEEARSAHRVRLNEEAAKAEVAFRAASAVPAAFNPRSDDQLHELFYKQWECEVQYNPKTHRPTVDKNALFVFRREDRRAEVREAANQLVRLREAKKTLEAFVDKLPVLVRDGMSRVHPSWGVFGAETLRWTCSGPNLQQLQKPEKVWDPAADGGKGKMVMRRLGIRDMFCAPPGYVLMEADYSQLELRLIALFAADILLLTGFATPGTDIHADNAQMLIGTRVGLAREIAKTLVYAMNYGADDKTIFRQLARKFPHLTLEWVKTVVKKWKEAHPWIEEYRAAQVAFAAEHGYVYCPFSNARIEFYMGMADPSDVVNKRIQRSGSDLMNPATVNVWRAAREIDALMCAQVHDALLAFVPIGREKDMACIFRQHMNTRLEYGGREVDVPVDVKCGLDWGHMEELKEAA